MGLNPYETPQESPPDLPPRFPFHYVCLAGLVIAFLSFGFPCALTVLKPELGPSEWFEPFEPIVLVMFWGGLLTFVSGAFLWAISR